MSVCFVCFVFDCVGELFVECVCYMCGWVTVFSLKVIVLFLGCIGVLLANPLCWCFVG